jgi:hypothetical protein
MKRAIVAVIGCVFVLAVVAHAGPSRREQQLLDLVNHEREKAGLPKLEWNEQLAKAALAHSQLQAQNHNLSHQFPGELPLQERVGATGLRFNSVAENVAEAPAVDQAHQALMHSPGHRANILAKESNSIGIAIVEGEKQELYVTQDFAHSLATFTEKQVRDTIVSKFNQARRARKLPALNVVVDPRLAKSACSPDLNTDRMIHSLPGATALVVFSQPEPGPMPEELRRIVPDQNIERLNIGVCLQTGGANGFSKFWIVMAFFGPAE